MELQKVIEDLKKLTARPTPKNAWKQGELLKKIKESEEYRNENYYYECDDFYGYIHNKLDLDFSEKQVNNYMGICEKIPWEYIETNSNMLLEHLYTLIKTDEAIRLEILEAMSLIESDFKQQKTRTKQTLKRLYRAEDIRHLIKNISNSKIKFSSNKIKEIILSEYIADRIKANSKPMGKPPRLERDINILHFPEFQNLHPKEPIDEQGLVAFFCTIFHLIRNIKIRFPDYISGSQMSFSRIIHVKASFPDARIEFIDHGQPGGIRTLDIEFEYESNNYIDHKHKDESPECHMIICWFKNWHRPMYYAPIFSLKELLDMGEIKLHYYD
jgi:hypothetical protein